MLSLISARRDGKQTTEEWGPHLPARSCRPTSILTVSPLGPPLIGPPGTERRLFGVMSSQVIVTRMSYSQGPQYAAKTEPIYCVGRERGQN